MNLWLCRGDLRPSIVQGLSLVEELKNGPILLILLLEKQALNFYTFLRENLEFEKHNHLNKVIKLTESDLLGFGRAE